MQKSEERKLPEDADMDSQELPESKDTRHGEQSSEEEQSGRIIQRLEARWEAKHKDQINEPAGKGQQKLEQQATPTPTKDRPEKQQKEKPQVDEIQPQEPQWKKPRSRQDATHENWESYHCGRRSEQKGSFEYQRAWGKRLPIGGYAPPDKKQPPTAVSRKTPAQ